MFSSSCLAFKSFYRSVCTYLVRIDTEEAHLKRLPSGLLQSVRDVYCDGTTAISHEHNISRVHNQIAVPKHGAPLTDHDIWISCIILPFLSLSQISMHLQFVFENALLAASPKLDCYEHAADFQ